MNIDSYAFGKMTIDGVDYDKDLIILPNRIIPGWWRHTSHVFDLDDCKDLLASKTDLIVFGLGAYGLVKLDDALVDYLKENDIPYKACSTAEAMEVFNSNSSVSIIAGAFHLTC